jgi:hypothetical protein
VEVAGSENVATGLDESGWQGRFLGRYGGTGLCALQTTGWEEAGSTRGGDSMGRWTEDLGEPLREEGERDSEVWREGGRWQNEGMSQVWEAKGWEVDLGRHGRRAGQG